MVKKVNVRENAYEFQVSDTSPETEVLEIYDRFGSSRNAVGGFFAHILFTAAFTGTIEIHLGPTKDTLVRIPELDMKLNNETEANSYDIVTRAHYLKIVVVSGGAFTGDIIVSR